MTSTPIRGTKGQTKAGIKNVVARVPQKPSEAQECQHSVVGVCTIHGPGAKMKYKPIITVTPGPDGKITRTMKKKRYFVCDLALPRVVGGKGEKLSQTQLSFNKTTMKSDGNVNDSRQGEVGDQNLNFSLSMNTVGQTKVFEEHLECNR